MARFEPVALAQASSTAETGVMLEAMVGKLPEYQLLEQARDGEVTTFYLRWRSGGLWFIVGLITLEDPDFNGPTLRAFLDDPPPDHVQALAAFVRRIERNWRAHESLD